MEKQKLLEMASEKELRTKARILKNKQQIRFVAWLRFLLFAAIIGLVFYFPQIGLVGFILAEFALLSAFLFFVRYNYLLKKRLRFDEELYKVNNDWVESLNENYAAFHKGSEFIDPKHAYSYDADIFGTASVFQMLNRTVTLGGKIRLARKLRNIVLNVSLIKKLQKATEELGKLHDFRQNFYAYAQTFDKTSTESQSAKTNDFLKELLAWTKQRQLLKGNSFLTAFLYIFPIITVLSGLAYALGFLSSLFFVLFVIVQLGFVNLFGKRVQAAHLALSQKSEQLKRYEGLMKRIAYQKFESEYLLNHQTVLSGDNHSALFLLKKMRNLLKAFDARLNILLYFMLNSLLMWDLQILLRLEQLKSNLSKGLSSWFDALSEFDALMSLGDHAYSKPEFCYPEICGGDFVFQIKNGGHPLLPSNQRVGNNFAVSGLGKVFIVTGANMAGKSTFLRTIAVNMTLASCGTKVCADAMKYRPIQILTSVRTTDSVQKNESYFYAELMRLKQITDRLKQDEELFVILDEMLKGTNSEDKHTGSKGLIEQLIRYKVVGLAATHDTELGYLETKYPEQIFNKRFEAEIKAGELHFDYIIKDGISRNLNAVFLMKKFGIIPKDIIGE